ncbi:MAG: indolepyruvate ferredoxin oxidoreductase subunit alpha, partial [Chloroflexi bacterium]|nr:indolepyruvate ferredoxin oxidoreductase subunit alpha [Chloroflexota bacterium]
VYAEWSPNEKVAMEVGLGAAYAGVRTLVSMKHVGLNVASDPFFAASVTGPTGGLVVISADDPGMHSSQNEQDNRHYARFAKVPLIEPTDSQEAYGLIFDAFEISERFDTPVLFRSSTRISHSKSVVEVRDVEPARPVPRFVRSPEKYVMIPANARRRHPIMEERIRQLAEFAETFPFNRIEPGDPSMGIISSGVAYQYAREVFPDASYLKLCMSYPLPTRLVKEFASQVERLIVVEELDPFLEEMVRALGLEVTGKEIFPIVGEFNPDVIERSARTAGLLDAAPAPLDPLPKGQSSALPLPARPPVLCPGCPHSAAFYALKRLGFYRGVHDPDAPPDRQVLGQLKRSGAIITGDIGCYTLAVLPPLLALDTTACMGASIGQALGLEKAGVKNKVVAVIGDSTFFHSGITPLLDVVYNNGTITTVILDNSTTAMTGHQGHPGTGTDARGNPAIKVDLEMVVRGLGVRDVHVVDAFNLQQIEDTLRGCVMRDEPSVVIVRGPCALQVKPSEGRLGVDLEGCDGCAACVRVGCPAISYRDGKAYIDPAICVGEYCNVCGLACPEDAIKPLATLEGQGSRGKGQGN